MEKTLLLIVITAILGLVSCQSGGFNCYVCSYGENDRDLRDCITHPDALGSNGVRNCSRNCVFSEQYDIGDYAITIFYKRQCKAKDRVTSYFRSCGVSVGNICTKDYTHITCYGTCKGEFCNMDQTGSRYKLYLERHKYGDYDYDDNSSTSLTCSIRLVVLTLTLCLTCLMYGL